MILKERKIPIKLQKLEAILRRIPSNHPKRPQIEEDYKKTLAGYRGEQAIDYHLSFLPDDDYLILHDLRLLVDKHYVQIDILVLHQSYFLIIEVKNLAGTLYFDQSFNQLIRSHNEKEEGFSDPIMQVAKQKYLLQKWLVKNKLTTSIKTLVVISNPSTIIKASTKLSQVTHAANLSNKILEMTGSKESFTKKEIRRVARLLIKSNLPREFDILKRYQISTNEIINGIQCPNCQTYHMFRRWGTWICNTCLYKSKNIHIEAINDYFLLIDSTITNEQLRKFLKLTSTSTATKLLSSLNLPNSGKTKGKKYSLTNLPRTTP